MNRSLLVMLALATVALAASLLVWANRADWLPEEVPTHWGFSGKPDAFLARESVFWYLLLVPLMMFGFTGLALLLPWLSPRHFEIAPFRATYDFIMIAVVVLFTYLHGVILAAQLGWIGGVDLPRWLVGGMLLFMILLGNVLGKVRRNFWVGVRTPWTLASDLVWTRTHRLAAWLFVGGGLVGFLLILIGIHPIVAMVLFFVAAFVPVFYSLWLYKRLERQGRLEEVPANGNP